MTDDMYMLYIGFSPRRPLVDGGVHLGPLHAMIHTKTGLTGYRTRDLHRIRRALYRRIGKEGMALVHLLGNKL
jgi:hypothetical protein